MGVTRKGELDVGGSRHLVTPMPGIVGEQEFEATVGHALDGSWQVSTSHLARLAFVLDANDSYLCAVTPDEAMFVEQQVPAYLSLVVLEEV